MLATTVLLQMTFQRGAAVLPDILHEMGLVIAQPRLGRGQPVRGRRDVEDRRRRRADAHRDDGRRAARQRRAGRVQADLEEAEARLQPAQPLQGHQEDGRHAGVVGARSRPSPRPRCSIAVAWPAFTHAMHTLTSGNSGERVRDRRRSPPRPRSTILRNVSVAGLVVAAADYAYQKRRVMKQLRMTRQELREEMKQQEGNPRDAAVDPVARHGHQPQPDDPGGERGRRRGREPDALRGRAEVRRGEGRAPGGRQGRGRDRGRRSGPRPSATGSRSSTSRSSPGPSTRPARSASSSPPNLYEAVAHLLAFVFGLRAKGRADGLPRAAPTGPALTVPDGSGIGPNPSTRAPSIGPPIRSWTKRPRTARK